MGRKTNEPHDDFGPWYVCDECGLDWQAAPDHPEPDKCPECEE